MKFAYLILISTVLLSCQKTEGPGGKASIRGKVYVREYNQSYTQLLGEYYAAEEDVYIIYGDDDDLYDDDMKTNYDGSFEFNYLTKGKYKVFVYTEDTTFTVPGGKVPVFVEIEIKEKKDEIVLDDIVIIKS